MNRQYKTWAVVVPSNRPERLEIFKRVWAKLFDAHNAELIVVLDEEPYEGIPDWIPRRTDMIRSWGFYKAWLTDADYVLSLDDDTYPRGDPFPRYEKVFKDGAVLSDYLSVGALTSSPHEMRGFPHHHRERVEVAVQYGGWDGVLDYDAETQLGFEKMPHETFYPVVMPVPRGVPVTTCAMNMAWRREYTPIMWQLPMLDGRYNRWGDIWSGLLQKAVLDSIGKAMVINGKAQVIHERASDPVVNLEKERPGRGPNLHMWRRINIQSEGVQLGGITDMLTAYAWVSGGIIDEMWGRDREYAEHFADAREAWLRLFGFSWSRDMWSDSTGSAWFLGAGVPS